MYSPLPRSAQHPLSTEVKRGVTPFFGLPEKGDGGMSTCAPETNLKSLLFIPVSHNIYLVIMKSFIRYICLVVSALLLLHSCRQELLPVQYDFNTVNNRVWIGEDFWAVPLEDWRVNSGKIEFIGEGLQSTCSLLPYVLNSDGGGFTIKLDMGLSERGENEGASGLTIGSTAPEEDDIRAAVYFGRGINLGINTSGFAFIGQNIKKLPPDFDLSLFKMEVNGQNREEGFTIILKVFDKNENIVAEVVSLPEGPVKGIIQIVNNFRSANSKNNGPEFWYDNISLVGEGILSRPENKFGPVLWTMHTLSRDILKISAQMPPAGDDDNQEVELQVKKENKWISTALQRIEGDSRTATFRVENWNSSVDHEYRILYHYRDLSGNEKVHEYYGTIRKDPVDRPLYMAAMTCQYHTGFPYTPVVKNLERKNPDIMYFSGDQIYEQNGGYPIKREPEDTAILNYLGKWYMFGWAFGDLMRDIPTICTPDDHDVFQGNLWGGEGIPKPSGLSNTDDYMGFTQTVKFINVVNATQCNHLPDPYDPTPIEQGMNVWYTSLNYGRVSFAIVSDRIFKSGPNLVSTWEGRKDHLKVPLKDPSVIDKPELQLLGRRQELFLEQWVKDWNEVDMKVLLSQTLLANAATHHGTFDGYLLGDLDSGGWPRNARDRAVSIIRKGFVFHICGDQHVPSIVQYGTDDFRDAGWAFCTPAIAVGYSRWFRPDELNIPVRNRPEHGFANTGEYTDAFGNKNYVYSIGNPVDFAGISNRYEMQQNKTAGLGFVIFDKETRDITMESWHFMSDALKPDEMSQHPGWPKTISQFDNYGRESAGWLPTLKISGDPDPVVEIINQTTGELEYIVRIKGNEFIPGVFSNDRFIVRAVYPEKNLVKELTDITPYPAAGRSELIIDFN